MGMPEPLRKGDIVRIIAPSSPFPRDRFDAGIEFIEAMGFRTSYVGGLFATDRFLAGNDNRRAAELRVALGDPNSRCIWVARGGYGATRLLPLFEAEEVAVANKWLVGFSDVTALHCLWARAGCVSLHGANVTTLGEWSEDARAEMFAILCGEAQTSMRGRGMLGERSVSGPLMGGNLAVLAAMVGTAGLPCFDKAVVLLEDVGERPYRLDRTLTQLLQAGTFDKVAGFAIGQLTDCVESGTDFTALDVVVDALSPLGCPIVAQLPIGHEPSSRAITLGANVVLDPQAGTLGPC